MVPDRPPDHALLSTVFETSPLAIVVLDRDGRIYLANAQAEKTLRLRRRDITRREYDAPEWTITDFQGRPFPADQLPFARVKRERAPVQGVRHAITSPDGTRVFLNINAAPLFDPQGELDGMVASLEDITGRVAADLALAESEAMLRSVFRAAPVGIGVVKSRVLTWTNHRLQQMVGYSEQELLGRSARMLYPSEEDFEYVGAEKYRQISISGTGSVETRWLRKDGRIIDVLLSSTPIDLAHLERGVTFSALDITERKLMEERLRHSEKMEAVGQLAGGVAHDFNNQLAGIMGYADLLREELGGNQALGGLIEGILTSVRRSAALTAQLLAFARKGKYLTVTVDVHRLVFEVVALLKHSISKSIRIRQMLAANPSTTRGDPSQLQNAVLNLALNARDAMPDGGELSIETANVVVTDEPIADLVFPMAPGTYVRIDVTDTGCGIEPSLLGRVFEPFFTTKPEGKGTGMGLAAVYGSLRNHHGGIAVRSQRGRGTTFSLYVPSCPDDATALVPTLPEDQAAMLAGRHILFVDDEHPLRKLVVGMLAPMGCRISVCADGQQAIELYRRSQGDIDVVVLDLVMPKMDGKTAYRALKQLDPAVKVLLLSGFSIDGDAQQLLKEGARGFLQKPFQKNELVAQLAGVLRGLVPASP